MSTKSCLIGCMLAATLAVPAWGTDPADPAPKMTAEQQKMMDAYTKAATPGPEHARLARMVGTWDMQVTSYDGPTPHTDPGTAVFTLGLGGRVLTQSVQSSMGGMPFEGSGSEGYDNVSKKYWSVWTDSMSTGPLVSWGRCDASGICKYEGTSNDPVTGKAVTSRMTLQPQGPDKQVFDFWAPGPDGKDMKMMQIVYTRKK